jgi:predicted nucleic acid-binding protein
MALILDADSLIKLNRVGALELAARAFECIIREAVYQEAVVNARARGYTNAESIDSIIKGLIQIQHAAPVEASMTSQALGVGESEVLALGMQNAE